MRDEAARRVLHVVEEDADGYELLALVVDAEALEVGDSEQFQQTLPTGLQVETPVRKPVEDEAVTLLERRREVGVLLEEGLLHEHLPRLQAGELLPQPFPSTLERKERRLELTGGEVDVGFGEIPARGGDCDEVVVAAGLEVVLLGDRAGRDDLGDLAVGEPLPRLGDMGLLADRNLLAGLDESRDVAVGGMVWDAAHRHPVSLSERQTEQTGHLFGVPLEHLVEVAESKEQYRITVGPFHASVLLHHRRGIRHRVSWCRRRPRQPPDCRRRSRTRSLISTVGLHHCRPSWSVRMTTVYPSASATYSMAC